MKLWTFGDSFSVTFDLDHRWIKKYVNHIGYIPKIYSQIIAESLDCTLVNCAKTASSNYDIIHRFYKEVDKIDKEDLVIIQFSSVYRYRLVDKSGNFSSMASHWDLVHDDFNESSETLIEMGLNRFSEKYLEEIDDWIKVIKMLLPSNRVIFWSPFYETVRNKEFMKFHKFTDIIEETNGAVKDNHYGEIGHRELSDFILRKIINNESKLF